MVELILETFSLLKPYLTAIQRFQPSLLALTINVVYSRNLFNKGCRVPLRGKVNEAVHTGLRVVDTILPIGRGQRQLVIGDRFTGKTNIYISTIINQNRNNFLKSIDGFGSKRVFGVYVGINQNLSRIYKIRYTFEKFNIN